MHGKLLVLDNETVSDMQWKSKDDIDAVDEVGVRSAFPILRL